MHDECEIPSYQKFYLMICNGRGKNIALNVMQMSTNSFGLGSNINFSKTSH